jgi:hypothetical protein
MIDLHIYEHGTLKPGEVILRKEKGKRDNNGVDESNQVIVCIYGNVTAKPPIELLYTNKSSFKILHY